MTRAILVLVALLALTATSCGGLDDAKKCAEGTGDLDLDIEHCTRAIDSGDLSDENVAIIFYNRGFAYHEKGEYDRAIAYYDLAIQLNPDNAYPLSTRGNAYAHKGEYDRAIELKPDYASAFNNKAWVLATARNSYIRDGQEAVRLAQEAVRLNDHPGFRDTLAAAYAEAGRFADAVAEQERVIEMAQAAGMHDQIADFQSRLYLYRRRQAYRE